MFKRYFGVYNFPEDGAGVAAGTTDNGAGSSVSSGSQTAASAGVTDGRVSSGTATEAMIKAATAASSAEEAGAASAAKPVTGAGAATGDPNAAATTQATTGDPNATGTQTQETGPVPLDRHQKAVENARAAGASETQAKYEKSFGWVRDLGKPSQVKAAVQLASVLAQHGPLAFAKALLSESNIDPRELLGAVAGKGGTQFTGDEEFPDADLRSSNGTEAWSKGSVVKALGMMEARLKREFQGQLRPLSEAHQTAEQSAVRAAVQAKVDKMSAGAMTKLRAQPHWPMKDGKPDPEGEKAIAGYVMAMDPEYRASIGGVAAFWEAFNQYKAERVYPNLGSQAAQKVRDENARKAAASVGAHPSGAGQEGKKTPLRDGDINGLAKRMSEMAEAGVGS